MRIPMSTHKIIKELIDENLIGAKKEINDILYEKLGNHLNEMYVEIAPTLLGEKKKHKKRPDFLDFDEDGDKKESMKKALKDKDVKENYDEEDTDTTSDGVKSERGADNLRPRGAPTDEPGDLSKKKRAILAAMAKSGGSSNLGTDVY
tara:strand:+ start:2946 stop:3389 length:444 start_codon:yes stop_codon:yes gene_type:complete